MLRFDVGPSCVVVGNVRAVHAGSEEGMVEGPSLGSAAVTWVLPVTAELLGVAVNGTPAETEAASLVAVEKSPSVLSVAEDIKTLLSFGAELFFPSFDAIINVEGNVPSVDLTGVLTDCLLISLLSVTFLLALAVVAA